jgi:hypothetical protein
MKFSSGKEFLNWSNKAVTIIGMSGVGKTTLANMTRKNHWFTYNVDYRIGTRYMGEHIVDNFKREAMKSPLLADLLRSDSIYISSNISFNNLAPLSTYLGKPGNPEKGGISFDEYRRRQAQHLRAEIAALKDIPYFIDRAKTIYGYSDFFCDTGGSVCEVINFDDPADSVLKSLTDNTMIVYIKGSEQHTRMLVQRFKDDPKPMYYRPQFLEEKWAEYKKLKNITNENDVDPDDFTVWGFEQLLHDRMPRYEAIAANHGYTIDMGEIPGIKTDKDLVGLLASKIDNSNS